jgi:hypothetical protein
MLFFKCRSLGGCTHAGYLYSYEKLAVHFFVVVDELFDRETCAESEGRFTD